MENRIPIGPMKWVHFLCASVLGTILVAGLWPFHAPANNVRWLPNQGGLEFGGHGSAVSVMAFPPYLAKSSSGTIEIWLKPGSARGARTILAFEGTGTPASPLALQQEKDVLRVRRYNIDDKGTFRTEVFDVPGAFREEKPVFIAVMLEPHSTSVYLDGALVKTEPISGESSGNFTGRLVLANSPFASDSWSGQILGLASYDRYLTPAQAARHYTTWTQTQRPAIGDDEAAVALYRFNERGGRRVHNELGQAPDLTTPRHYFLLHPPVLTLPWHEYRSTWDYWTDFAVNIAGFVPLGFSFLAFFYSVGAVRRPELVVILLGLATSLTIEILQAFLPTRNSGMTDLMSNTLGTAIGVLLYRWSYTQRLLSRTRQKFHPTSFLDTGSEADLIPAESAEVIRH
jgi:VanZ family protein